MIRSRWQLFDNLDIILISPLLITILFLTNQLIQRILILKVKF